MNLLGLSGHARRGLVFVTSMHSTPHVRELTPVSHNAHRSYCLFVGK